MVNCDLVIDRLGLGGSSVFHIISTGSLHNARGRACELRGRPFVCSKLRWLCFGPSIALSSEYGFEREPLSVWFVSGRASTHDGVGLPVQTFIGELLEAGSAMNFGGRDWPL